MGCVQHMLFGACVRARLTLFAARVHSWRGAGCRMQYGVTEVEEYQVTTPRKVRIRRRRWLEARDADTDEEYEALH